MVTRIRVPLIGTGVPGDAYRVDLPTKDVIAVDYANMIAVVDIPDADLPPNPGLIAALTVIQALGPAAQAALPAILSAAWRAHIDRRYAEHAGQYTLDRK